VKEVRQKYDIECDSVYGKYWKDQTNGRNQISGCLGMTVGNSDDRRAGLRRGRRKFGEVIDILITSVARMISWMSTYTKMHEIVHFKPLQVSRWSRWASDFSPHAALSPTVLGCQGRCHPNSAHRVTLLLACKHIEKNEWKATENGIGTGILHMELQEM
jgi:hypothetical protein